MLHSSQIKIKFEKLNRIISCHFLIYGFSVKRRTIKTMEKRYPGFLIASILIANKLLYCHSLYESPVRKKNVLPIRLKEQILSLAKESIAESILQVSKEVNKNLEDLRVETRRWHMELYEEIYNIKATLIGNETALENQRTSRGDDERHWLMKLAYLEAGMKKTAKESKSNADTLQEKVEILESQNGMMLSRLAATEMTLMKVTSQSSKSTNDSEVFISTHYLQKLNHVDERLNDINETIQDVFNTTVDIRKAMDSFQSEVMTLKDSVDALNIYANSTLDIDTRATHEVANLTKYIQLNLTKVISDNELYFSKNLNQTATELQTTIEELRHSQNETKSNMSEIRMHQRSTNTSISHLLSSSLSLQQLVKECVRNMNNFESKTTANHREIKNFQQQLSMLQFKLSHFESKLNESVINNENFTFIIKEIQQEFAGLEKSVKILKSNLSGILQKQEYISDKMKDLESKWSSFQLQCTAKVNSMNDSVISNRENLKDLLNFARAINASFGFRIKEMEITLIQLADRFSFVNNSIINLELDLNSSKILQERSYRQLNNITTTVDDLQRAIKTIVNDLMRNLSLAIRTDENIGNEMKNMTLEWSFLMENSMEIETIKQKVNSTAEDSKDLKFLIDANSVCCKTNIKDMETSLKQFTVHLSSVDSSISTLQQDLNSSKIIQERSKDEIYKLTTTIQELQNQINNSGMTGKRQEELTSLFESITDHETRLTRISLEVTSNGANIASSQSNLSSIIDVNNAQNETLLQINNMLTSLATYTVRLIGGSSQNEDRVEVLYFGTYGTVCDDSWDNRDAKVVCRMLGYTAGYKAFGSAYFGSGSGTIWLDDVSCTGSENYIFSCGNSGIGTHNCGHHEDASVRCY